MTLSFPNGSRSYDARRNLIRFLEYDSALEVSFFVEVSALYKPNPQTRNVEAGYLEAFDAARDRIHETARKVHWRACEGAYLPASADF
jgi:ribosomal protein L35AE/L33A